MTKNMGRRETLNAFPLALNAMGLNETHSHRADSSTCPSVPSPSYWDLEHITFWLRERGSAQLDSLWRWADQARRQAVGDDVHLRGLIEFSNRCVRHCLYCGLREPNQKIRRYRMSSDEIMAAVDMAVRFGYGTVVLQSGENPNVSADWIASIVQQIKSQTSLAVTLCLGERNDGELALWRRAGADRYLLRLETSNEKLLRQIHPPRAGSTRTRIEILRLLRELGYEVGSGVMIGIPGQNHDDLARDIALFAELDLDMIGCGPYLPHPDTPLGVPRANDGDPSDDQVAADELTTYKVIALARLVCPGANIPSTTALATLNREAGRELGLMRGANVVMPNLTPPEYRALYEIYPHKACLFETAESCHACLAARIYAIDRQAGSGPGESVNYQRRHASEPRPVGEE